MMKRVLMGGGVLAVTFLAGCLDEGASRPESTPAPFRALLMTSQDGAAGFVTVESRGNRLTVTLNADPGWNLRQTHVAVACAVHEVPQDGKGNPLPEFFASYQSFNPAVTAAMHELTLPEFDTCRSWIVVAHAFVGRSDGTSGVRARSAWGEGTPFLGNSGAMYMVYTPPSAVPPPPPSSLSLRTETQNGWIMPGPADYLLANFHAVFPDGLTIGGDPGNRVIFTSPDVLMAFFPQTGPAGPLSRSEMNPITLDNALAGEVVALTLNVEFDLSDPDFGASDTALAGLVVNDPGSPCFGMTVLSVLDLANEVLAGGVAFGTATPEDLRDCAARINANFDHGGNDLGYLRLP